MVKVAKDNSGVELKDELVVTQADLVILDLPPFVDVLSVRGVVHADLVLIPIGPSELDTDSAKKPLKLLAEVRELKPQAHGLLVPTRVRHNTAAGRELRPALEMWGRGEPLCSRQAGLPRLW